MSASCPELFNSTLNADSAKKKPHGAGAAVGEPIFFKNGEGRLESTIGIITVGF
jgi:hypothetical protein